MKIKIAYSPIWWGLSGVSIAIIMGLAMQSDRQLGWWLGQSIIALLCIVGALIHGHFVWKRKDRQRRAAKALGVPVERTVMLGKNAIAYVPDEWADEPEKKDGPVEWAKNRTRIDP